MNTDTLFKKFVVMGTADDLFSKVMAAALRVPQNMDKHWLEGNITAIEREIEALQDYLKYGNHFEVERVGETVPQAIARLRSTKKDFEMALLGCLPINTAFLSATRKDKLPTFITQIWHSKKDFRLMVKPGNGIEMDTYLLDPFINPILAKQYFPSVEYLMDLAKEKRLAELSIGAHFSGSIPQFANEKMKKVEEAGVVKEGILIAQSPEEFVWHETVIMPVVEKDPLAICSVEVGYGLPDQFYLVVAFNLTKVEKMIAEQYVVQPR